eukprot:TRINITY_DN19363_c0_g1_i1.p1 TRINITY_DN19363_c0_g1~~TRINITY_DN19363_c0_g1_i1.p1  ORF type:complete len:165 (+),score=32.34 TRINITY_DN19363_c0_g1_i1:50-544(+)
MSALDSDTTLESRDKLTLEYLDLLEEIALLKLQLESVMHDGFQNLSQTRQILGQTAISPLSYSNVMEPTALMTCEKVEEGVSFDLEISPRVMSSSDPDKSKGSKKTLKRSSASDPICWFAALPPQSLRSAKTNFQKSLVIISRLATLQSKAELYRQQIHIPVSQ